MSRTINIAKIPKPLEMIDEHGYVSYNLDFDACKMYFWPHIMSLAIRDNAESVNYFEYDNKASISYSINGTMYDLVPPTPSWIRKLNLVSDARKRFYPGFKSAFYLSLRGIAGGQFNIETDRQVTTWLGHVWKINSLSGFQCHRLDKIRDCQAVFYPDDKL